MDVMNALSYGGIVAVIGMLTVFAGLIILIGFLVVSGKIFQTIDKKKAQKAATPAVEAPAPAPVPVAEPVAEVQQSAVVDDPQLIAVIAAAIAAYDNTGKTLVVRKVRRMAGWKDAARSEQIYHF